VALESYQVAAPCSVARFMVPSCTRYRVWFEYVIQISSKHTDLVVNNRSYHNINKT